ncbi:MAG TPA: antibiotic biosynthesis monooxygenase [Kofleriaceae bacterium]
MIVVAGQITVDPPQRDTFVKLSLESVAAARQTPACLDFVVAADPIDASRVNVFELWQSEAALEAFRGAGPGADLSSMIVSANVRQYRVNAADD